MGPISSLIAIHIVQFRNFNNGESISDRLLVQRKLTNAAGPNKKQPTKEGSMMWKLRRIRVIRLPTDWLPSLYALCSALYIRQHS
jgi:hypothetical protein